MSTLAPLKRRRSFVGVVALSAAAALGVAGCGGDDSSTGAAPGSVASFIPSTAPMYFEISTQFDGPQWTTAKALAAKFPAFPDIEKQFAEGVASEGVDWEKDIKPLLGDDAALAVLEVPKTAVPDTSDLSKAGANGVAGLAQSVPDLNDQKVLGALALAPDSGAKVIELIKKEGTVAGTIGDVEYYKNTQGDSFVAVADGAMLVATTEADLKAGLEAHTQGGNRTFAGNTKALDLLAKLPDEVLMQAYIDAGALVKQGIGDNAQLKQLEALGLSVDAAAALSVSAEDGGIRLKGVTAGANSELLAASAPFSPKLTANVPGDAVAYVGFSNLAGTVDQVIKSVGATNPDVKKQLDAATAAIPLALGGATLDDVKALATGEHALVVTKGTPAPTVSLLLDVDDGAAAKKTLDGIANALPLLAGQISSGTKLPDWKDITEGGNAGRQLAIDPRAGVVYGTKESLAVVGTQPSALGLLNAPATGLSQDADFVAATGSVPDEVTSLIWVDIAAAVEVADTLGAFKAGDAEAQKARDNVKPLQSLVMWSTVSDGSPTVEAFLSIK
jgi:Protein of unknown function (DUF3352)